MFVKDYRFRILFTSVVNLLQPTYVCKHVTVFIESDVGSGSLLSESRISFLLKPTIVGEAIRLM